MENLKNNIERLCSFYVSDWHLVTMILPYINKELNEKANIITILENNMEKNIKTILSKLRLKNEKKILKIDWKNTKISQQNRILEKLKEILKSEANENVILINGIKKYVDETNEIVMKELGKILSKDNQFNIKIINCYEVTEFNGNIREILDHHDKILNTSGEKEIEEVFEGYSKMSDVG